MRYCLHNSKNKYRQQADEILVTLPPIKDIELKKLVEVILEYKDKQINLYIKDAKECLESHGVQMIQAIKSKYPDVNIVLVTPKVGNTEEKDVLDLIAEIKDAKLPFFTHDVVIEPTTMYGLMQLGVSEMYISGELGFKLDEVSKILHKNQVKIRAFPNIAQIEWKLDNNLKAFYIRPEDIELYEQYIDTVDFYCETKEQEEVYYKVYAIDKKWSKSLKFLIKNLTADIEGVFVTPAFAEKRIRCGQECLLGGKCRICERAVDLSKVMMNVAEDL